MSREEVIENLKQIEKDLDVSLNRCMSPFNPMIVGTEYQRQKMQEMLQLVRDRLAIYSNTACDEYKKLAKDEQFLCEQLGYEKTGIVEVPAEDVVKALAHAQKAAEIWKRIAMQLSEWSEIDINEESFPDETEELDQIGEWPYERLSK